MATTRAYLRRWISWYLQERRQDRVAAAQGGGEPEPTPDVTPPSAPTGLVATPASTTAINLTWNDTNDSGGSGLAGYQVFRNGGTTPIATPSSPSYQDTGLVNATLYSYTVKAIDGAGNVSSASNTAQATTGDVIAPAVPANVVATPTSDSAISLAWDVSADTGGSGTASYRIYRDGSGTPLATVTHPTHAYSDTGLASLTSYSYTVRAVDAAGNESAASSTATAKTAAKWRFASVQNAIHSGLYNPPSPQRNCICRIPYRIGSGAKSELRISFAAWYQTSSSRSNIPHTVTVLSAYFETNGMSKQITFNGGATTLALTTAQNDIQSDSILPSLFGLTEFEETRLCWVRIEYQTPSGGNGLPFAANRSASSGDAAQWWWYDTAVTTITNGTSGTGAITRAGTGSTGQANPRDTGFSPFLLGLNKYEDTPTYFASGSSTFAGSDDSGFAQGKGLYQRALAAGNRAGANFAVSGIGDTAWLASALVKYWVKYAKYYVDQLGAGNIPGTLVTIEGQLNSMWTYAKDNGVTGIIRINFNPRTTSSDNWATLENQTPATGWGATEQRKDLHDYFQQKLEAGVITRRMLMQALSPPGQDHLWIVNGVANYATNDGTHPTNPIHLAAGAELSGVMATLT